MKRIEAIIRPSKQASVLASLAKLDITNVTVIETLGLGNQPGFSHIYEPAAPHQDSGTALIPKKLMIMFVEDSQVQSVLDAIQPGACTGNPGDGIMVVSQVEQIVRIRPE